MVIPAVLSALMLFQGYNMKISSYNERKKSIFLTCPQRRLILLFFILFLLSILILILAPYRPWYYFVLVAILYIIVFLQILSKEPVSFMILLELILILIELIYGTTFKYPLYFGATDIPGHIFLTKVTYLSGHIVPPDLNLYYTYFPLYHIFISQGAYILGSDIKTSLFLILPIPYVITVLLIYFLFNGISKNRRISLLSSFFYSNSYIITYYGTYLVTRAIAFVGFAILLYLLYREISRKSYKYKLTIVFISVFILLIHNVSIIQISVLLVVMLIIEFMFGKLVDLSWKLIVIINTLFIGYWTFASWSFTEYLIKSHVLTLFHTSPLMRHISISNSYFFLTHIDISIATFFTLVGIGYMLQTEKQEHVLAFGVMSIFAVPMYVPNPLQALWQTGSLLRFDRFKLFVTPFIAFAIAWGFYVLNLHYSLIKEDNILKRKIFALLLVLVVMGYSFMSITMHDNANDCKDFPWKNPRTYFNKEELYGFSYIIENVPSNSTLYSDYYTYRFFEPMKRFSLSNFLGIPYYVSRIIPSIEDLPACKGYLSFRKEEFFNEGLYFGKVYNIKLYKPNKINVIKLVYLLQEKSRIYSNPSLDIYR
ncbi:hypothetical protein [Thermococcus gammatolerans]|uniref:hypothetical protein n=1 Tax=Thermococcus gammatolerans TaxID=187878 RepID=UPI0011D14AD9|nr:hypothetical protein [Thermococcus gammatolerans]